MSSLLPHSEKIRSESQSYLGEVSRCFADTKRLGDSSDFRSTYKATLAADAVLSRLASSRCKPRLSAHRTVVRRSLAAFSLGQPGLSRLALRQAIELTFWTIYFSEHSVEWVSFEGNPSLSRGEPTSPIRHAAHREPAFYRGLRAGAVRNPNHPALPQARWKRCLATMESCRWRFTQQASV